MLLLRAACSGGCPEFRLVGFGLSVILEKQRVGWLSARSRRPMSQVRAILPEALSVSRSTSAGVSTDSASSYRAIETLIATYAELVDGGDFAGIGALLPTPVSRAAVAP